MMVLEFKNCGNCIEIYLKFEQANEEDRYLSDSNNFVLYVL